jgi:hypothetical protein
VTDPDVVIERAKQSHARKLIQAQKEALKLVTGCFSSEQEKQQAYNDHVDRIMSELLSCDQQASWDVQRSFDEQYRHEQIIGALADIKQVAGDTPFRAAKKLASDHPFLAGWFGSSLYQHFSK